MASAAANATALGANITSLENAVAAIQAQQALDGVTLNAIQAQQALDGATFAAIQVQLANIAALLGGGSTHQRISIAMASNRHDSDNRHFVVVPTVAGGVPPNWPIGFSPAILRSMLVPTLDALHVDYGLPLVGNREDKRRAIALHIGAVGF